MTKFDFGSLKPKDTEVREIPLPTKISTETPIERKKKSRISLEQLQHELNKLKKEFETFKQGRIQNRKALPEEIYKGLWIMCRSFRSQYRNKSDSMLGQLTLVMNYFHIDLINNPFNKLKESE